MRKLVAAGVLVAVVIAVYELVRPRPLGDEDVAVQVMNRLLPAPSTAKHSNIEIIEHGPHGWVHARMWVEAQDERGLFFNKHLDVMFRRTDSAIEWSKQYAVQELPSRASVSTMKMLNGWGTVEEPAAPTGTK